MVPGDTGADHILPVEFQMRKGTNPARRTNLPLRTPIWLGAHCSFAERNTEAATFEHEPTIAAIDGFCVAGGLELALACDIRIATRAARFALPEVRWGILPGGGGTQRLGKIVGLGVAMRMIMTGDEIGADFALRCGLITDLVEKQELEYIALIIANRIVKTGPLAVVAARQALLASFELPMSQGLAKEAELQRNLLLTDDAAEGVAAFSARRQPEYSGR
jgi:enoyl-CoA hydratase/carnithine racemase